MSMIGLNKRGQEGLTLTTLLLIVLGVVVVVVIILGATGIFGDIFSKREALPGNLEAITQGCKISAQANLIADFCYEFKELENDQYVNCDDPRIKDSLTQQAVSAEFTCTPSLVEGAKKDVCKDMAANKKADTFFNNNLTDNCDLAKYKDVEETTNGETTNGN